jgi:hypothetical protein
MSSFLTVPRDTAALSGGGPGVVTEDSQQYGPKHKFSALIKDL